MINDNSALAPIDLSATAHMLLASPKPAFVLGLDAPAVRVMTDLRKNRAITITPDTAIDTALTVMIHANVRLLLVTADRTIVRGVVSSYDLMGERPLQVAAEQRITRAAVTVAQVMTPVEELGALDRAALRSVSVRDIVRYLVDMNRHHALVVEPTAEGNHWICGIFSASQIGRQLGYALVLGEDPAQHFFELERLIA